MRYQQQFDSRRIERPGGDSYHPKPLCFRSPPRAGEHPRVDGSDEQCRGLDSLLGEKPQHGQTVDVETVDRHHGDRGVAGREDFLQTIRRIGFDVIASQALRNRPQDAQRFWILIQDQQ